MPFALSKAEEFYPHFHHFFATLEGQGSQTKGDSMAHCSPDTLPLL